METGQKDGIDLVHFWSIIPEILDFTPASKPLMYETFQTIINQFSKF